MDALSFYFRGHKWFRSLRVSVLGLSLSLGTLGASNVAHAHGGGSAKVPQTRAPAPPGDGAQAEKLLAQVEAASLDPKYGKVVEDAVRSSVHALERAAGARASGDSAHARMLDGLALEWAETARDLLKAAKAEDEAMASAKKARELSVQVERARALLAETEARRGRAAADLKQAETKAAEAAQKASEAEQQRLLKSKSGDKVDKTEKKSGPAPKKDGQAKPKSEKPAAKKGAKK